MHGTIITFEPDKEIFGDIKFDLSTVVAHIRQQAYLVKKLKILIIDAREMNPIGKTDGVEDVFYFRELGLELPSVAFYFEGGLVSLVKYYNKFQKPIQNNILIIDSPSPTNICKEITPEQIFPPQLEIQIPQNQKKTNYLYHQNTIDKHLL